MRPNTCRFRACKPLILHRLCSHWPYFHPALNLPCFSAAVTTGQRLCDLAMRVIRCRHMFCLLPFAFCLLLLCVRVCRRTPAAKWQRHPHGVGAAGPCGRGHDDDLHPRDADGRLDGVQPAGPTAIGARGGYVIDRFWPNPEVRRRPALDRADSAPNFRSRPFSDIPS